MRADITGSVNGELPQSHGPLFLHLIIQRALVADKDSYLTDNWSLRLGSGDGDGRGARVTHFHDSTHPPQRPEIFPQRTDNATLAQPLCNTREVRRQRTGEPVWGSLAEFGQLLQQFLFT